MPKDVSRPRQGGARFYTRDSGGKAEMTPAKYVGWACGVVEKLGLSFRAAPEDIGEMIRNGECHRGDLFLDYDVPGHTFKRDGLDRLLAEVMSDRSISHVLIPRRDRFARPSNPTDAVQMELKLRMAGITLIFMDRVCEPIQKGQSPDIGELIVGLVDYYKAGKDRRELAEKLIYTQIALAQNGFSIGGRPRYAFDRWLVKADGTPVRRLEDKERVRLPGHHTAWLPATDNRMSTALRIRELLKTMPASRVAAQLTREGVPSPDAGRTRTDGGVTHPVSGVWHQTTIVNIGRNALFAAIVVAGRRSMGDQLRLTPHGPRQLSDADFRVDNKPKVVQNPADAQIVADAHFEPLVDPAEHEKLNEMLDERAGSQRGRPRSRDPDKNPLGGSVFDLNCGWPMYRTPSNGSFRYKCGSYIQSHGEQCDHNHVDGPTATRTALRFIRDSLRSPGRLEKLKIRLNQLATAGRSASTATTRLATKRSALKRLEADLAKVECNLALAENQQQFQAIANRFDDLKRQEKQLRDDINCSEAEEQGDREPAELVAAALSLFSRLPDLVHDDDDLAAIGRAFRLVKLRMFFRFEKRQVKRRLLNQLTGGVVTFGDAPPPIPLYLGPTGRRALQLNMAAEVAAGPGVDLIPDRNGSGQEGDSLRNVSRGDRI